MDHRITDDPIQANQVRQWPFDPQKRYLPKNSVIQQGRKVIGFGCKSPTISDCFSQSATRSIAETLWRTGTMTPSCGSKKAEYLRSVTACVAPVGSPVTPMGTRITGIG